MSYSRAREEVETRLREVGIGQRIRLAGQMLKDAFPASPFAPLAGYGSTREAFLHTRVGASWGVWTCDYHALSDTFEIGHNEPSSERVEIVDGFDKVST